MNIVDLRQCPDELQQLAGWHHEEWVDYNPGLTLDQRIERMQPHLGDAAVPSTYVAVDNGVLGSADIVHHDMTIHQEFTPWLASVYVEQSHRRQGIGRLLVKHVMQCAAVAGYSNLYLYTPDQMIFYQHLGWQILEQTFYCGHNVTITSVDLHSQSDNG